MKGQGLLARTLTLLAKKMAEQDKGVLLTPLRSVRSAQLTALRRPGSPTHSFHSFGALTASLPLLALRVLTSAKKRRIYSSGFLHHFLFPYADLKFLKQ